MLPLYFVYGMPSLENICSVRGKAFVCFCCVHRTDNKAGSRQMLSKSLINLGTAVDNAANMLPKPQELHQ